MEDWNPWHEAVKAGYSSAAAILVLAVGWLFGQRLTYVWNIRQKRRELQLTASQQFYSAYGEFFAVWKIWNRLDHQASSFDDRRWELLIRAAGAEAIIEGMLVKLSAEVTLESSQIETLARFRQAFQQLRESVRDSHPLPWSSSEHPGYKIFKGSAVRFAALLAENWRSSPPSSERASRQLMEITSNKWMSTWAGVDTESKLSPHQGK